MSEAVSPVTPLTVMLERLSIFCDDAKVAAETGVVAAGAAEVPALAGAFDRIVGKGVDAASVCCGSRAIMRTTLRSVE